MLIRFDWDRSLHPPDKLLRQEPVVHHVKTFDEDSGNKGFEIAT